jgi:hypothetical protein
MKKIYFLGCFVLIMSVKAFAQPSGWSYSTPYQITENSSSLVLNYQARLTVNTASLIGAGQMLATGDDIRFGKDCAGNTLYNYWIESGINTASTVIWVKIDSLYANSTRTFYMFYGNSSAGAVSAIPLVFNGPMSATDSVSGANTGGVTNSQRGFRFAPTEDILATAFGKNEPNGSTRYITLFNFSTQAILSQQQVSGPAGQYSYQNITSPLWLTQGTQYLLEIYQGSSDGYYFGAAPQAGQQITYYDMRYCNGCTQNTFPTNSLGGMHYGYVDMWYWTKNNVSPAPTISSGTNLTYSAGADTAFCAGDSALVGSSATGGNGPYTYSWSPTTGVSSPASGVTYVHPSGTTTYTITVNDNNGCSTSDMLTVTVNPLPMPHAVAMYDTTCPGVLNAAYVSGLSANFDWQPGGVNTMSWYPAPSATTTYTVTGTGPNGCAASDTMRIVIIPNPVVTVTGTYSFICDNAVTPLTMTATGASNYDWNAGAGTGSVFMDTPTTTQTYTVIGTANYGCADTTTYGVTLMPHPTASSSLSNDSICPGSCVTITGTATGGSAPYAFMWGPILVTTPFATVCPATTTCYTLIVTDSDGCEDTTIQCVNVFPAPVVTYTSSVNTVCIDDANVTLSGGSPAGGTYSGTGVSGNIFSPMTAGTGAHTITYYYSDVNGCSDSATHVITVNACTGIEEAVLMNGAAVYPNPFSNSLLIERVSAGKATLNMFDAQGRLVMTKEVSGTKIEIETSGLADGIYSVQLIDADGTKTFRVSKGN